MLIGVHPHALTPLTICSHSRVKGGVSVNDCGGERGNQSNNPDGHNQPQRMQARFSESSGHLVEAPLLP